MSEEHLPNLGSRRKELLTVRSQVPVRRVSMGAVGRVSRKGSAGSSSKRQKSVPSVRLTALWHPLSGAAPPGCPPHLMPEEPPQDELVPDAAAPSAPSKGLV